jgi:pimeloyl-ACP methyl ester carboxylesterase
MAYLSLKQAQGDHKVTRASDLVRAVGRQWPPPPAISLHDLLAELSKPQTPDVSPPFEEPCKKPELPPAPSDNLLDPSVLVDYHEDPWVLRKTTFHHAEGRLVHWLRVAAQSVSPLEMLIQSAVSFYLVGIAVRTPPDTIEGATALADLAVTGRIAYAAFRARPPQDSDLLDQVRNRLPLFLQAPPDENRVRASVASALDRAYSVAWALRAPNPSTRMEIRRSLSPAWIAVSGEDDMPDRPVNVGSAPYPQFDIAVTCPSSTGNPLNIRTRYMIAAANPTHPPPNGSPTQPIRVIPGTAMPSIPPDHEVILFIHGQSSRAEECGDLVNPLLQTGLQHRKNYAIIAFDLPCTGYSEIIDHTAVAPSNATDFDSKAPGFPFFGREATHPLLDFLMRFVMSFVDTLDQQVQIKNRVAAIIGGSLGGNLCLRLGERNDQAWIRNIVAWSAGSVWPSFNNNGSLWLALDKLQHWMDEDEAEVNALDRVSYFYRVFIAPSGLGGPTQPEQWYSPNWGCKKEYIDNARLDIQERYNARFRRWHFRVGLEELLFSHWTRDMKVTGTNRTNTLLIAGHDDNAGHGDQVQQDRPAIYSWTQKLAEKMAGSPRTPGDSLFLLNTGHSIHNERPLLLAQQIIRFIS